MNKMNDLMLFESVILHCQILHNITSTKEALVAAQKDGLIEFYNQLTSAGAVRQIGSSIGSLTEVSLPMTGLQFPCHSLFDLACKLRAELVPPISNGFITYIHASFMQKIFHISY